MSDHGEGAWLPGMRHDIRCRCERCKLAKVNGWWAPRKEGSSVTNVPADSLRPQSANLHSGDEVWVRGKFLRYRDDGKIAVQLYPNDQNFFTAEQVKQALLVSGHSSKHAVVLKDELNGLLAAAAPKPAPSYIQDHNAQFGFGIFVVTGEHQRTAFFTKEAAEQYLAQQHNPERFRIVVYPKPAPACEAPPDVLKIGDELNQCLQIIMTWAGNIKDMEVAAFRDEDIYNAAVSIEQTVDRAAKAVRALAASVPPPPPNELDLVRLVLSAHQNAYARFHNGEGLGVIEADQMAIGYASVELAKALKGTA